MFSRIFPPYFMQARDTIKDISNKMTCISCGSHDIRLSNRHSAFKFFYQLRGWERYRCRECRHAFWQKPEASDSERIRRKRNRAWAPFFQTRGRRAFLEITLFIGMLIIFFFAIRYIVNRTEPPGPTGLFLIPSSSLSLNPRIR
jgi:hypothetical protein